RGAGMFSASTQAYPVSPGTALTGSVWAKPTEGHTRARTQLVFSDARGSVLSVAVGRFTSVRGRWARLTVRGAAPVGAAAVALAVDDAEGRTSLSVDDASLAGSARFRYERLPPTVTEVTPDF